FIVPLGEWILKRAMRDMQQLHTKRPDFAGLSVAVNISAKQLNRYDFVNQVQKALSDTGYDPELLKLEITETAAMTNPELTDTRLGKLKKMGIEISLDDFGTGYSSLSYLRTLPVDCLKVDRSFVSGMDQSQEKQQIVRSVINLARDMNMNVVAEGVELSEHWDMLKVLDCQDGQGFYFSRPMGLDKIMELPEQGEE
ncbi:MAG: EAL domain-containing protein, partial [Proteobacteria bacterium]|nr:EAL domain-containing protein [Pseudomonadota bacterium]